MTAMTATRVKRAPLAATVLAVAGCASTSGAPDYRETAYRCDRGESVAVRFYHDDKRAVLLQGERASELWRVPTDGGFYYSNGRVSIRGSGAQLAVESASGSPLQCQAV